MKQENMRPTSSSQSRHENPGMQGYDSREGERRKGDRRGESCDEFQNDSPSNPDINTNSSNPRIYVHEEDEGMTNRSVSGGRVIPSEEEENPQVGNNKSESDPNIHG